MFEFILGYVFGVSSQKKKGEMHENGDDEAAYIRTKVFILIIITVLTMIMSLFFLYEINKIRHLIDAFKH